MNNNTLQLKIKQRLNKLDSNDYDNIEKWQIVEAFNKAQKDWCRRQLHGTNQKSEGDEQSIRRIDDLQILLTDKELSLNNKGLYSQSEVLPADYFQWKRIDISGNSKCCPRGKNFVVYLAEEANVNELLRDELRKPSYEWGETFCTLKDNRVNIFTNTEFEVTKANLVYYRLPRNIEIKDVTSPDSLTKSTQEIECEFGDSVAEVLVDETVTILAGDIADYNTLQNNSNNVENNN